MMIMMILQVPTATNLTHEHPGADTQIGQLAGIKNAKARLAPPPPNPAGGIHCHTVYYVTLRLAMLCRH